VRGRPLWGRQADEARAGSAVTARAAGHERSADRRTAVGTRRASTSWPRCRRRRASRRPGWARPAPSALTQQPHERGAIPVVGLEPTRSQLALAAVVSDGANSRRDPASAVRSPPPTHDATRRSPPNRSPAARQPRWRRSAAASRVAITDDPRVSNVDDESSTHPSFEIVVRSRGGGSAAHRCCASAPKAVIRTQGYGWACLAGMWQAKVELASRLGGESEATLGRVFAVAPSVTVERFADAINRVFGALGLLAPA
jgi:hypothetical protein